MMGTKVPGAQTRSDDLPNHPPAGPFTEMAGASPEGGRALALKPPVRPAPKRRFWVRDRRVASGVIVSIAARRSATLSRIVDQRVVRKLNDGKLPLRQVLLVADVLVARDQHGVVVFFGA